MKILSVFILLVITNSLYSQSWMAGDTTNYLIHEMEQAFELNSKVVFDLDCDGVEDVSIQSTGPIDISWPWERLSFYMQGNVQVYNSNTGFITTFESEQTVLLGIDSLWTENLDFIYGTGEAGPYGQYQIDHKYILFRKTSGSDTFYCPILFSNTGTNFTIHHILSNCAVNPIEIITEITDNEDIKLLNLYPNPSSEVIFTSVPVSEYKIYSMNGSLVGFGNSLTDEIQISQLPGGMYSLLLKVQSTYIRRLFMKN